MNKQLTKMRKKQTISKLNPNRGMFSLVTFKKWFSFFMLNNILSNDYKHRNENVVRLRDVNVILAGWSHLWYWLPTNKPVCHLITGLWGKHESKAMNRFLVIQNDLQLCWLTLCSAKPNSHLRLYSFKSPFNLKVSGYGIPCSRWPQRTRPWPGAVWLTGTADLICGGGSLKTDHYHTTRDRWNETITNNTTEGTPQHPKASSSSQWLSL